MQNDVSETGASYTDSDAVLAAVVDVDVSDAAVETDVIGVADVADVADVAVAPDVDAVAASDADAPDYAACIRAVECDFVVVFADCSF